MPRNLSLNISIGALLGKTVEKTFSNVTQSTSQLGETYRDLNRQLKDVSAANRYAAKLEELRAQAARSTRVTDAMTQRIERTEAQYLQAATSARRYGHEVDRLGDIERQLERRLERTNRQLARRQRISNAMGMLRTGLGRGAQAANTALNPVTLLAGGGVIGGAAAAITMLNKTTSEQANLAQAVGISAKNLRIWSAIVQNAGFDAEHVNSLVEELNNKFGESTGLEEQTKPVKEAMKILNLNFSKMKRLKPEEQFMEIIRAAQKLENLAEAGSAADILLGGEANRIVGYVRSTGLSIDDLMKRYGSLNVLSDNSIVGAQQFGLAWSELMYTMGGAARELSSIVGQELAPQMRQWATDLSKYFKTNRDDITGFASTLGTTIKDLGTGLVKLATNIPTIIDAATKLSELVLKWLGDKEPDTPEVLAQKASGTYDHGNISLSEQIKAMQQQYQKPPSPTVEQNNNTPVTINVTQQQGENTEQLATRVSESVGDTVKRATTGNFKQLAATP